ncbi:hypothetical protein [Williamsia muralis]|uniref:Bacteriocin resistance YdeI/OmpD-like protein n=1 Tax=Williamsia marianensis TaxID=85044 RepID=A0ABU4ETF5_WILMA|nr:hypothetical protein [Williamsia muralis]MDV7134520.1 hypothetical protein [Williamsia muralis]
MSARIPPEIETAVVAKLYKDAELLGWTTMTPQQHSRQYGKWVGDAAVGGKLTEYLSTSAARVWIKDGPMKEYSRAASGVGKYASLIDGTNDVQARIIRKALGAEWVPVSDSLRVKPLRLLARKGEDEAIVTWAPATALKHMVWAALTASAEGDPRQWTVCVTETFIKPTPVNEKHAHARLAKRCGLRLVHVTI